MHRIQGSPCWILIHNDLLSWPSEIAPWEQRAPLTMTPSALEYECRLAFPLHWAHPHSKPRCWHCCSLWHGHQSLRWDDSCESYRLWLYRNDTRCLTNGKCPHADGVGPLSWSLSSLSKPNNEPRYTESVGWQDNLAGRKTSWRCDSLKDSATLYQYGWTNRCQNRDDNLNNLLPSLFFHVSLVFSV